MGSTGEQINPNANLSFNSTSTDDEAFNYAMQIWSTFTFPTAFKVAIELDIFGIIAKAAGHGAGVSPLEVASHLKTTQSREEAAARLDRILRLLASYSLLTCSVHTNSLDGKTERLYGLTPAGKLYVRNVDEGSLSNLAMLQFNKVVIEFWHGLKDKILHDESNSLPRYNLIDSDPAERASFNLGMKYYTTMLVNKILETYKGFEGLNCLVDVGGNIGTTLSLIISKYPSINGINFDLPNVVKDAPSYPGIKHVGGDMFESVPKGEAIILKWICHNWDDERCLKLLKNCYEAVPENGKVIIIESVLPVEAESNSASKYMFQIDLIMLACHGGKERTQEEFESLSRAAGFSGLRLVCRAFTDWVVELYK